MNERRTKTGKSDMFRIDRLITIRVPKLSFFSSRVVTYISLRQKFGAELHIVFEIE